ncbi:MAG TPA: hypothetical protein VJT73_20975 [Polyangiaceae bacterium]|nr:hypothetical protein [Polyangiaceae bacterium]
MRTRQWLGLALSAAIACQLAACGGDDDAADPGSGGCCASKGGGSGQGGTSSGSAGGRGGSAGAAGMDGNAGSGMAGSGQAGSAQPDAGQGGQKDAAPDTNVAPDAKPDAGTPDTSAPDAGSDVVEASSDAGMPDTSVTDAGSDVVEASNDATAEAGNESGADGASDAAVLSAMGSLLQNYAQGCLSCALSKGTCRNLLNNFGCETLVGNAAAGPAAGQAKSALCLELLTCELNSKCGGGDQGSSACYCGTKTDDCFTAGGDHSCRPQQEKALETTSPSAIEGAFSGTNLAGGRANVLLQCLADNDCTACFL